MSNKLFSKIGKSAVLICFGLALASCGGGGGKSDGGFTNPSDTLKISIEATKTEFPANVTLEGPQTERPFTNTLTVRVIDEEGRLFPAEQISIDMTPVDIGALFYLDGDPENENDDGSPKAFRRMVFEDTTGLATGHFWASSTPGEVELIASTVDPVSGTTVSDSITMRIVDVDRTPTSLTFTGPFINAVFQGASSFGGAEDTIIASGTYQRLVSALATTADGTPARPNTQIDFFLIDGPLVGFPADGAGSFLIAGNDGDPLESGNTFFASSGNFRANGLLPFDRLFLDGTTTNLPNNRAYTGPYTIQSVVSGTQLDITAATGPFADNPAGDTGATVPYIAGRALVSNILARAFTDFSGTASTLLTYPSERVGQTAILAACITDRTVCTVLNRCDDVGSNCGPVFLPVSDGTNITLTSSISEIGANTTSRLELCLRDVNFVPIPATEIDFNVQGGFGPGQPLVDENGNDVVDDNGDPVFAPGPRISFLPPAEDDPNQPDTEAEPLQGSVITGPNGCAEFFVVTAGQAPGTESFDILFSAAGVAEAVVVTVTAPGAGKLSSSIICGAGIIFPGDEEPEEEGDPAGEDILETCGIVADDPTTEDDESEAPPDTSVAINCAITLFLQDERGQPVAGVAVTQGEASGDIRRIAFDPALGSNSGVTDQNGENVVTIAFGCGTSSDITFESGGAQVDYTINLSGGGQ